jgi:hypothetical protein
MRKRMACQRRVLLVVVSSWIDLAGKIQSSVLVGTEPDRIVQSVQQALDNNTAPA